MILTEYDEKKHFRTLFREGKEEGIKEGLKQGRETLLWEKIQKKLSRGKTIPEIAEELEESASEIERLINTPPDASLPMEDEDPFSFPGI